MAEAEFHPIRDRTELPAALAKAREETDRRLAADPRSPMFSSFQAQLRAIEEWTKNGRQPLPEEAIRLTMGRIAARELEDEDTEYAYRIEALDAFVCRWSGLTMEQRIFGLKP